MNSIDAIFLVSFGGPEGPQDVMPFLENVLRGKNVPQERKLEVAKNYEMFGGISPINAFMRGLKKSLEEELPRHGISLPVYWGNRNWSPYIKGALSEMKNDGIQHALAFFTSAYSSYSGCRQYREDIEKAQQELGVAIPVVSKIRAFYNHPAFVSANAKNIESQIASLTTKERENFQLVFTAHSIPLSMSATSDYNDELNDTAASIAGELKISDWKIAYQSRSGPPTQPWLEPSILDTLTSVAQQGKSAAIVSPIGFICDHMEVIYDLDYQAKEHAQALGLKFLRAQTAGHHPLFVEMLCDLISERLHPERQKKTTGRRGPKLEQCPPDCCKVSRPRG